MRRKFILKRKESGLHFVLRVNCQCEARGVGNTWLCIQFSFSQSANGDFSQCVKRAVHNGDHPSRRPVLCPGPCHTFTRCFLLGPALSLLLCPYSSCKCGGWSLFSTQIPTYIVVIRNRTVGKLSILPTIGTWSNCSAWCIYALLIKDNAILIVNVIGACIALVYLALYLAFSPTTGRTALVLIGVFGICATVYAGVALPSSMSPSEKSSIMGSVAVACNVAMFAAPIAQLRIALMSFDPNAIPALLILVRSFPEDGAMGLFASYAFESTVFCSITGLGRSAQ
jgi:hypothetical protein